VSDLGFTGADQGVPWVIGFNHALAQLYALTGEPGSG
jgi:hypothetical protein